MLNEVENSENTKISTESNDCGSTTDASIEPDDCMLSIKNIMCEDNDHVKKMIVKENEKKLSETTYSVQEEHSYNKNYELFNEEHIPESTDTTKTDNVFECESCELDFTTAKQLNDHTFGCKNKNKPDGVMSNEDLKEEVLEIDNYEKNKSGKIQQMKQNVEQTSIKIGDTLEKFEIKTEINEELIIKDEPPDTHDDIFECETCELAFDTEIELISHTSWCKKNKRSIETSNPIKNNCASIKRSESLKTLNHRKEKLYPGKEPYECDVCERSFRFEGGLINHHKLYHTANGPFACNVCKRIYVHKITLMRHISKCTGEKPYNCDVCKKSFRFRSTLKTHKFIHTSEKPFACDVCSNVYNEKCSLTRHKRNHTGEKPYECDVCKKRFCIKKVLNVHKLIHTCKRPYKCNTCKKLFIDKKTLKQHKVIHTGEKSHECDVCRKSFRSKSALISHKLIHTGEKPYECDVCKRSFRQKGCLTEHKFIHTREKPFASDVCNKTYTQKSDLLVHTCIHTGEKL